MISLRLPLRIIAAVLPGPKDAEIGVAAFMWSGGDRDQWLPLSADQAARRLASGPVPASRRTAVPLAVLVSLSTCIR